MNSTTINCRLFVAITRLLTCIIFCGVLNPYTFAAKSDEVTKKKDHSMDIKNLLQEFIEDNGSVGASVAIIENGKTSFYTYGKKSVNGNDLVSKDTLFEIGSITKVFTTLLLAEMETQGRVKFDEPVEKYLPEVKIPERNGKKITFRHLEGVLKRYEKTNILKQV